ncbi:MAG TPA: hypothetical protein VNW90_03655 [Acetobacteraceae bacterium]|jgi:hypothetical protein|nr:hypothetical protein [Acetobacteraceae bacterium]
MDDEEPTFLTFSLRLDANDPIETVAPRVGTALGCALEPGSFAGGPAMTGNVLGIKIGLLLWRGIDAAHVFELHGVPDRGAVRNVPWQEIPIDRAIIDLLRLHGAGRWRQASQDEKLAAAKYDDDDI